MAYLNSKTKEKIIKYISDLVKCSYLCGYKSGIGLDEDIVNHHKHKCFTMREMLYEYIRSC